MKKLVELPEQTNVVDRILAYYKGTDKHLDAADDDIRVRIDYASDLMRQHNYDTATVRGLLVQKYQCSHSAAKNYIQYAEIIHAAFMEVNVNYELLWLKEQLKTRLATAKPDDKNYSKLAHAFRETLADIDKKQVLQSDHNMAPVQVEVVNDITLLDLKDYNREDDLKRIAALKKKAWTHITGDIEDAEIVT